MPVDCGLAFVVITHLDPTPPSSFSDVIRHWTKMRTFQAHNRQKIEPNCVYVIPSGRFLRMTDAGFRLVPFQARPGIRRAIDMFFFSFAETRGRAAAAVLC